MHIQIVVDIRVWLSERENTAVVRVMIAYELIERSAKMGKRYWNLRQCVERRHLMEASNVLLCDLRMEDDESSIK
jgi:hypothetical protein